MDDKRIWRQRWFKATSGVSCRLHSKKLFLSRYIVPQVRTNKCLIEFVLSDTMISGKKISENIRKIYTSLGLTQDDLAKKMD